MADTVQTVLGAKKVSELGKTLIHEHLCIGFPGWDGDTAFPFGSLAADQIARRDQKLRSGDAAEFAESQLRRRANEGTLLISENSSYGAGSKRSRYFAAVSLPRTACHRRAERRPRCAAL
ncbi:MAG: hypothetical protein QOD06_2228 [Candidatus Binatota bacterium]|nr:hypothetical protein [Candidatus Binatota bacterium]